MVYNGRDMRNMDDLVNAHDYLMHAQSGIDPIDQAEIIHSLQVIAGYRNEGIAACDRLRKQYIRQNRM